ncbi:signal transduction histidine kinase [Acidovorax sp. 69]|uniref:sensor histidine kinase n=1 Tax=Acidovorax sp. 69 TaxID=2035202 RepID=UPI000C231574|nr:ATP-binding protein [Acidovorax sp. 69]PJI99215.1 signal transduction histidine kinase [Acidovorax sp. 69]
MKHGSKAYFILSLVFVVLAGIAGGLALSLEVGRSAPTTWHVRAAQLASGSEGTFAPLPPVSQAAEPDQWQSVALPHTWPQSLDLQTGAAPRSIWLQVPLDGLPATEGGLVLYLPRWQTVGRIAVYGDDRLLYRSVGDVLWNGFNYPLWVSLDGEGLAPRPKVLRLRIDSLANAGGTVSSLWIGQAKDLWPRYRLRRMLQTGVAEVMGMSFLGLGGFALAVWLLRRERTYLLFALFTLLWALRSQRFHVGLEPLPISSAWFGWMTINAGNALLVTWYAFMCTLVPTAPRWPVRVLLGLLLLSSAVTLPVITNPVWIQALAPLPYLVTNLVGIPATLLMAWAAWRHGGREGLVAASIGLLHLPVAVHDWMMHSYLVDPEHIYAWPFSTAARIGMFLYVILNRYVGALATAEQSNAVLAQRLHAREKELAVSYEQLRSVQQRQLLNHERNRLMQDIHDGMGSQLMSALKVAESGGLSEAKMAQVLRECIDDLKLTVDSLECVEADLLLLLATLRYRLAPRLQGSGLTLRWEVKEVPTLNWLDPRSALHVLRILQEGISNIIQHSGASEIRVATGEADGGVYVLLEDNGLGFSRSHFGDVGRGLSNMARRAHAIGGQVAWDPVAGGTRFTLWLPLRRLDVAV